MKRRVPLGQHFLHDAATLDAIVAAAALQPGESVLEIGPGPGNLTRRLAEAVGPDGRVIAVEADKRLAAALDPDPHVEVVVADAVQADLAALAPFSAVVSNLPYQISGPITVRLLALLDDPATRWHRAVLMYQKEFAERLQAAPRTPDYGRLTVHTARHCRVEAVRDVPPGAFRPPPRVHSRVLLLAPHQEPPFAIPDEAVWRATVDGAFAKRRKKLRNALPPALVPLGVPPEATLQALEETAWTDSRAEELAPADFARLTARLCALRRR